RKQCEKLLVAGDAGNEEVKIRIGPRLPVNHGIGAGERLPVLPEHGLQSLDLVRRSVACGFSGGKTLQHLADVEELDGALARGHDHAHALARGARDELALLKPADRFAQRSAADAVSRGKARLAEFSAGRELAADDRLAQLLEQRVGERPEILLPFERPGVVYHQAPSVE